MTKLLLILIVTLLFTVSASADVIAGPMIAIIAGVYVVLPLLLVALVLFITIRLIRKLKQKHKEDET